MPAGRPTKYTPELLETARRYVEGEYSEQGDPYPMICGLAINLKVSRETVHAWSNDADKEAFSDIVRDLMAEQERKLFSGGIKGDFNPSITKLALTKHGYTDKSETTLQGAGGGPVKWEITGIEAS